VVEQHHGPIHLLMTDVVMPEMGGAASWRNGFSRTHPETKVLFLSGYLDDAVVRTRPCFKAEVNFLQKNPLPWRPWRTRLREVLDSAK